MPIGIIFSFVVSLNDTLQQLINLAKCEKHNLKIGDVVFTLYHSYVNCYLQQGWVWLFSSFNTWIDSDTPFNFPTVEKMKLLFFQGLLTIYLPLWDEHIHILFQYICW